MERRSQVEHIRLVDINQGTVEETWPLLMRAVDQAHFIAVDLELSGLGRHITKGTTQHDEKYKMLREVVSSYAIVSMGVACFQWQPASSNAVPCRAEVFNILLLSQHSYTVDPSSAKFLLKHGFDFNKQLRHGLPYTAVGAGGPGTGKLVELFRCILLSPAPLVLHNGWLDLLHLYHMCHAPLPTSHDSLITDLAQLCEKGGVFDTKAIARYHHCEETSFLEYIYKKALIDNSSSSEGVWLELMVSDYPTLSSVAMETVPLPRIPDVSPTQLEELTMCQNVIRRGVCEAVGCGRCHDVAMAILQEIHCRDSRRQRRKRKKREGHSAHSLVELFQKELSEAQSRLATTDDESTTELVAKTTSKSCDPEEKSCDIGKQSCDPEEKSCDIGKQSCDPEEKSCDIGKQSRNLGRVSCGHRAGFDAFMTGYTFAYYSLQSLDSIPSTGTTPITMATPTRAPPTAMSAGLVRWQNCLSNRWSTPIRIAASQYCRPSHAHTAVWTNIGHTHSPLTNDIQSQ